MTDWKQLACQQADTLIAQALGYTVPVKARCGKGPFAASAAPRACRLDREAVLKNLSTADTFFEDITLDNGFLNFHFGQRWFRAVLSDLPEPAAHASCPAPAKQDAPAAVCPWDVNFLTVLTGKAPHWTLAARQDRENPAWLVRYTAKRLAEIPEDSGETGNLSTWERQVVHTLADYPALSGGNPRRLARFLHRLAAQVWESSPRDLSPEVRLSVSQTLTAGMAAF